MDVQRSEVGNVGVHLGRIGAELDRFLEFRSGDAVSGVSNGRHRFASRCPSGASARRR